MQPEAIASLLKENEKQIAEFFDNGQKSLWNAQPEGKWSAGQHIIHLVQSTKPLLKALHLPLFLLKWRFGISNRPSRTSEEVIKRYQEKLQLAQGIVSPFSANMPQSDAPEKDKWLSELRLLNDKLNKATLKLKDKDLDTVLLPHPLMGKMTLREILIWNAYHTVHHHDILKQKYV
jgi:hypothetical protein